MQHLWTPLVLVAAAIPVLFGVVGGLLRQAVGLW